MTPGQKKRAQIDYIRREIIQAHGLVIGGKNLAKILGYPNYNALRASIYRGSAPVPVTQIEGRKGYFAAANDVAKWAANISEIAKL